MEHVHEPLPCSCGLVGCAGCAAAPANGSAHSLMRSAFAGHDETASQGTQAASREARANFEVHEVPASREGRANFEAHDVPAAPHGGLFVDPEEMKQKIRNAVYREEYDVAQFYYKTGVWQYIARHPHFEKATLAVIAFNALWIWVDTDLNEADVLLNADPTFQIAEHFFCTYFAFEWTVRFKAFRVKRNGLRDGWFVFDSCLVFMMVAETWVMTCVMLASGGAGGGGLGNASILRMARLLRLSRMARMARLFRAMPELLILIKGMVAATRSVLFTLCLLAIILYVFGIAFRQLCGETVFNEDGDLYFGSVWTAMHTLLLDGTLMDGTGAVVAALAQVSWAYVGIFYLFILLAALTVMNMLIGVLCEVVSAVASTEKEALTVAYVKAQVQRVLKEGGLDKDQDGKISKEEFSKILEFPVACRALEEVGVDVMNLVDNIDFIFADDTDDDEPKERQLSFGDFMELVLSLRGCNTATVKDIVDLRKFISSSYHRLRDELRRPKGPSAGPSRAGTKAQPPEPKAEPPKAAPPAAPVPAAPVEPPKLGKLTINKIEPRCYGSCACLPDLVAMPSPPSAATGPAPLWYPEGIESEELEMWHRRGRLVDALVTAQAELQRFVETLPPCDLKEEAMAKLPALPLGTPELLMDRLSLLLDPTNCVQKKSSMMVMEPVCVRWLPGELTAVHSQLTSLQKTIANGLESLHVVRERFTPTAQQLRRDRALIRQNLLV